jgi:predicted RNA-binding Zn-ribbon protein involved in translation (DUF1610 family)
MTSEPAPNHRATPIAISSEGDRGEFLVYRKWLAAEGRAETVDEFLDRIDRDYRTCHDELAVICPMCGLGRAAIIDTCTSCGLVLKVKPRAVAVRTTPGPKPGGAAAA